MKSYRDYLNERKIARGPWVVYENCEKKPCEIIPIKESKNAKS